MGAHYKDLLLEIQERLFTLGAMLATDPQKATLKSGKERLDIPKIVEDDITLLESEIDAMNEGAAPNDPLHPPWGHPTVSYCHVGTICRRAGRMTTYLDESEPVDPHILAYLNRLSDYLFVLARKLSHDLHVEEIKWIPKSDFSTIIFNLSFCLTAS